MDLNNDLEDTRGETLMETQVKNILCEEKTAKDISIAIYKAFPRELAEVKITLEQYNKAIKSNVIARFDYFNFEELDEKMKKIEEIDEMIRYMANGVKLVADDISYEKNNINKISEEWIKEINEAGEFNTDKIEVVGKGINRLKSRVKNIEKSKTNIFSLTNILLVAVAGTTAINTYHLFFKGQV